MPAFPNLQLRHRRRIPYAAPALHRRPQSRQPPRITSRCRPGAGNPCGECGSALSDQKRSKPLGCVPGARSARSACSALFSRLLVRRFGGCWFLPPRIADGLWPAGVEDEGRDGKPSRAQFCGLLLQRQIRGLHCRCGCFARPGRRHPCNEVDPVRPAITAVRGEVFVAQLGLHRGVQSGVAVPF